MASILILKRNRIILTKSNAKCLLGSKFANLTVDQKSYLQTNRSQLNQTATKTSLGSSLTKLDKQKSAFSQLDLTFTNTKEAYKSKRTSELIRAYLVLKLCSFDRIVLNHEKLLKIGQQLLGNTLFTWIVKKTFYAQFCAGEDEKNIKPKVDHLKSFGVKAIFDYSAEDDMIEGAKNKEDENLQTDKENQPHVELPSTGVDEQKLKQFQHQKDDQKSKYTATARTYFYLNEAQCEKNMEIFLRCIDAVAGTTKHTGFAAVKLTALGRPQLLLQLSEVIVRTRMFFSSITGEDQNMALGQVTATEFKEKLDKRFDIKTDDPEVKKWFEQMDYDKAGLMNLFSWNGLVDMDRMISDVFKVINIRTGKIEKVITCLTREEEEMFKNMMRRIHTIAKHAKETDVRVMIDAEQSYFQPAINRITLEIMRKYNKEKAIIFNTYQCYLKKAYENLLIDMELARRQNFYFGAKLVRGAYIMQERARAKEVGYEDPINPTFKATTDMYHKCLSECMTRIKKIGLDTNKISIMVASHNEDTVRYTVNEMEKLGIKPEHKIICFGQLLGMCDHVSFLLGQSGYSVYKYCPYGPVDEVVPYLSRRAVENHGVLEKVEKERSLMIKEIGRRLVNGQLFHKPIGNYMPI